MFSLITILSITFILTFTCESQAWVPYKVTLYNVTSESCSDKVLINTTLSSDGLFSATLKTLQDYRTVFLNYVIDVDTKDKKCGENWANRSVYLCNFFKSVNSEPFLMVIYQMIRQFGNVPTKCPMEKGTYSLKDLSIDSGKFPPYVPHTSGCVTTSLETIETDSHKKKPLYIVRTNFKVGSTSAAAS